MCGDKDCPRFGCKSYWQGMAEVRARTVPSEADMTVIALIALGLLAILGRGIYVLARPYRTCRW